jgi:hypothetical protein
MIGIGVGIGIGIEVAFVISHCKQTLLLPNESGCLFDPDSDSDSDAEFRLCLSEQYWGWYRLIALQQCGC